MATRILVVDDDISLTAILKERLLYEGFEVNTAADGHEGYLAYLRHLPDMILTDVQMPGENGLELMEHVWTHNPEVKAIYMTGEWATFQSAIGQEEKKLRARVLRKPFSGAELMRLVFECLNSYRSRVSEFKWR
jgi:two-component system, OmpR family, response regulator MprA